MFRLFQQIISEIALFLVEQHYSVLLKKTLVVMANSIFALGHAS